MYNTGTVCEVGNRPPRVHPRSVDCEYRFPPALRRLLDPIPKSVAQNALNTVLVERRGCDHLRPTCRSRPVHGSSSIFVRNCSIWSLRSYILLYVTLGAPIDICGLFPLFRLGRERAKPIALPCRCLSPRCLQYWWVYFFFFIHDSSLAAPIWS